MYLKYDEREIEDTGYTRGLYESNPLYTVHVKAHRMRVYVLFQVYEHTIKR